MQPRKRLDVGEKVHVFAHGSLREGTVVELYGQVAVVDVVHERWHTVLRRSFPRSVVYPSDGTRLKCVAELRVGDTVVVGARSRPIAAIHSDAYGRERTISYTDGDSVRLPYTRVLRIEAPRGDDVGAATSGPVDRS